MSQQMEVQEIKSRVLKTEPILWKNLKFIQDDNFKEWIDKGDKKLVNSLLKYQFVDPFKVWEHDGEIYCLDGKHRTLDLQKLIALGANVPEKLPATFLDCSSMEEAAELVLVYSSAYARITQQGLFDFADKFNLDLPELDTLSLPGFDDYALMELFNPIDSEMLPPKTKIADDFVMVPFSILDSRSGEWLARKRQWLNLGFNSQESREDVELIAKSGQSTQIYELRNQMRELLQREPTWDEILNKAKEKGFHVFEGASIFDPVLCELMYRWFCVPEGKILDPFAGGSVRGIVAGMLDFDYHGIDLREDQVKANVRQAQEMNVEAEWYCGDSDKVLDEVAFPDTDFIFSCPPYAYLEKYSDDPDDLSNMSYEDFLVKYRSIIEKSVRDLKDDSFACFVVGDIRDKVDGTYKNFVSDTIAAFQDAGMKLYNEMILINAIGSMAIRLKRQFNTGRKCGKIHQNVLVFYKGNHKNIKEKFGELKLEIDLDNVLSQPNIAL